MGFDSVKVRLHANVEADFYALSGQELNDIESKGESPGLFFQAAELFIVLATAFLISLLTASFRSDYVHASFVLITVFGYIVGGIFAFAWFQKRRDWHIVFDEIRSRQMGPAGDETKPLSAAAISSLQPEEASPSQPLLANAVAADQAATVGRGDSPLLPESQKP